MAKIHNSRAKVYETRDIVSDEPVEHLESEGERLIKQMVKNQLATNTSLETELKREKQFQRVPDTLPLLTAYISGETSLKEFQQTANEAAHIEELKSFGLSSDEIALLLNFERNALTEKYKKTDQLVLSSRIQNIVQKVHIAKKEREDFLVKSALQNRHQKELGLSVKPDSEHTKLLKFVLSCQRVKSDPRPPNHPINNLKSIEEELFGHLSKKKKTSIKHKPVRKSRITHSFLEEPVCTYSYQEDTTLWDVTPDKVLCSKKETNTKSTDYVYTCKPEILYSIKNGEIVPVSKPKGKSESEKKIMSVNDEYVVTDIKQSGISLIPLENILANRMSLEEIKSLPRFSEYLEGIPSKVLYIKNLSCGVTKDDLVSLFGNFECNSGDRISYRLLSGRMKGQAFITFPNSPVAAKALRIVNGYILKGRPIIVQFGKGKANIDSSGS